MTLNRRRLLRYAEYAAVSASVAGAIAAVATRQLVYGVAPLSAAAALNLINRRQWEQQLDQRLVQTTTQIGQGFDDLVQQNRQLEQRLQSLPALPEVAIDNFAQISDLQALREEGSRLFRQLSDDLQVLRQNLAQQEGGITRSELDSVTADLRQLHVSLAALESLNFDARLQGLEQPVAGEPTGVEDAVASLRIDLDQLREDLTGLRALLRASPSTAPLPSIHEVVAESPEEAVPSPELQWQPPQLPSTEDFTLEINLGIDFGTGFTKVCFRDLASDRSEIVTFSDTDEAELEQALLSTKVAILDDGTLLTGLTAAEWPCNTQPVQKMLEFIKMRLAHLDLPEEADWRLEQVSELDDPNTVENLCAYYLSRVITRSQDWIQQHRSDWFINQVTRWSLNIGVPVEYCDSPALERFKRVLDLAWLIANTPSSRETLTLESLNCLGTYLRQWMQDNLKEDLDCFTTPEISAAVWSFLSSRQAAEKFYTFFDFGDGTLDGTAFRFWREGGGELKVDFYTGQVQPLGVTAFTQQTAKEIQSSPETVRQALLEWEPLAESAVHSPLQSCKTRRQVQQLVASVVVEGREKHQENRGSRLIAQDELGDHLDVFVGGGGGHNAFLQGTVEATHEDFQHHNSDIPTYRIKQIPVPDDLSTNGLDSKEFHRFAVAYGLCIPEWEGPEIRLPSQVEANTRPMPRRTSGMPRYEDTRDMM